MLLSSNKMFFLQQHFSSFNSFLKIINYYDFMSQFCRTPLLTKLFNKMLFLIASFKSPQVILLFQISIKEAIFQFHKTFLHIIYNNSKS